MSNFRSVVERTLHLQLQNFTHFRTPISLFVTLVVLPSFPNVGSAPSASISALAITLRKAFTKLSTSEGILNTLFNIFTHALHTVCLRVRIHVKMPIQWRRIFNQGHGRSRSDDSTYATPRAEAKYWRVAGRYRRRLYSGNSTASIPSKISTWEAPTIPVVTYYTPRLLPLYRDRGGGKRTSREMDTDAQEGLGQSDLRSLDVFKTDWSCVGLRLACQCHPTLGEAAVWMKYYSKRDLREIQRIARLLPDEQVFGSKGRGTRKESGATKYREMWKSWLENKGMDLVIVFE
ncbi:hypothetical protein J3R82DRAFT_3715 [Butyriboletus roseoflavus]|nr:hypothetical protein J3R82DRAFT_3715 [Butyriboletus roseoflavus]